MVHLSFFDTFLGKNVHWPQPQHFSPALLSSDFCMSVHLFSFCISLSSFFAFPCVLSLSLSLPLSLSGRSKCNWLYCCWGFVLRRALIFSFTQNAKWRLEAVRDFTRLPVCVCVCVCARACLTLCSNKNCTRSECILIHASNKLYKVFVWCTVTSLCTVCVCVCVCVGEANLWSPNYS